MNKVIASVIVLLSLFSCKEHEESNVGNDNKYGGTLHINVPENIYSLIPNEISNESEWFVAGQIYETIIEQNSKAFIPNNRLINVVRQVHRDTIHYEFRAGLKFSNGRLLDSASLVNWVNHLTVNGLECQFIQGSNALAVMNTSLDQANAYLSEKNSYLFSLIDDITVGTGPFSLNSINEDISIDLVKNINYQNTSLPYLDGIEVRMIKTKATEVEEFINGSLDLIRLDPLQRLLFNNALSLNDHPNFQLNETDKKAFSFGLAYDMDSIEVYQLAKVLNNQPVIFDISNEPRELVFPNLSKSKISTALAIDSDNSAFSQLTVESLIENGVPLTAVKSTPSDQKYVYLTTGELNSDGFPLFNEKTPGTSSADYLIILNSWSSLAVYQYYLKTEDQTDSGMIDLKSVYFKDPIKLR